MPYRDFEIEIRSRGAKDFEVEVTFDGADETIESRFDVRLPPSYLDLLPPEDARRPEELRNWRRAPDAGEPDELPFLIARMDKLRDYGERLFRTVLPPQLEQALGHLLAMGGADGGVRIRIDLERAPALAKVPWEALFRRSTDEWYGISERSPMVRRISRGGKVAAPEPVKGEVRLLVAIAVPQKDLDAGREIASIEDEIRKRTEGKATRIAIQPLHAATRRSFESALADFDPHIVHFIGHGSFGERDGGRRGVIHFVSEDDPEGYDAVASDDMRDLLANNRPLLVVLNTCEGGRADEVDRYGGTAQNIVRRSIPYVVAMQYPISDEAALAFSRYFYERILEGAPVDVAVARGRAAIRNRSKEECQVELITPVLYSAVDEPGPIVDPLPVVAIATADVPNEQSPGHPAPDGNTANRKLILVGVIAAALTVALALAASVVMFSPLSSVPDPAEISENAMEEQEPTGASQETGSPYEVDAASAALDSDGGTRPDLYDPAPRPESNRPAEASAQRPAPGRLPASLPGLDSIYGVDALQTGDSGSQPDDGELPVEPVAPVVPPPAPPPTTAFDSAIAFFDFNSRTITPYAASVLDNVASAFTTAGGRRLVISGYTDRSGSVAVNLRISRERAAAVADYLVARGVPAAVISIEGFGESNPRVPTADGVHELQNRRVEITLLTEDGPATESTEGQEQTENEGYQSESE